MSEQEILTALGEIVQEATGIPAAPRRTRRDVHR